MASELQEALNSIDIEDFLEYEGLEYRERTGSRGPQFNLHECPSCGDRKWRVWMNQDSGLGNCFHGDCTMGTFNKYSFIRAHLGNPPARDIITYIKRLAIRHGWKPQRKKAMPETSPLIAAKIMPERCVEIPDANGNYLEYLSKRGISEEISRSFNLSYCDGGYFRFYDPIGEREAFQYYGDRLVIPVFDLDGEQRTFQGRDLTGTAENKYLFPPGLPASGRFLYGGNAVKGATELVVTEGVFDCWSVLMACRASVDLEAVGVVATFGMHLSDNPSDGDDQVGAFLKLQRLGLQRVTFMWDGEKRALKKALDAAMRLKRLGLTVRVAILPDGKDPNEVCPEEIVKSYYSAKNLSLPGHKMELLRKLL